MFDYLVSIIVNRFLAASHLPKLQDFLIGIGGLSIYAAIALPLGFKTGFLQQFKPDFGGLKTFLLDSLKLLILPGIVEESIFRVGMIPHPLESVSFRFWLGSICISLFLFIIAHPVNALTLYKAANPTFFQPIFLILAGLLGLLCTIVYSLTGSWLIIILVHWSIVMIWWFCLEAPVRAKS